MMVYLDVAEIVGKGFVSGKKTRAYSLASSSQELSMPTYPFL